MLFASLGTCMICGANAFSLFYSDAIVNKDKYSVMGVDVAHYQGVIDWNKLEEQGVDFAFIKATEGSGHVDCFSKSNLNNISKTNIYHSAYHFFSFDSSGETQAENYISAVDKNKINLPPVIDVEYYGNKSKENPYPRVKKKPALFFLRFFRNWKAIMAKSLLYILHCRCISNTLKITSQTTLSG